MRLYFQIFIVSLLLFPLDSFSENSKNKTVRAGEYIITRNVNTYRLLTAKNNGGDDNLFEGVAKEVKSGKRLGKISLVKAGIHQFIDTTIDKNYNAEEHKNWCEFLKSEDLSIEKCEPNYTISIDATVNDPYYSYLWGMNTIEAETAWDTITDASDVVVAVIDTGIDYNHEDLSGNVWTNPGETVNGIDDDGNGYVDDIYGINTSASPANSDPYDDNGHGTHCSGTIGAVANNSKGVSGVAWSVKLMGIKFLTASGSGSTYDAIEAIEYAVDNGADIISASWGGPSSSESLQAAIELARDSGVLFVAAAGNDSEDNDSTNHYPSNYSVNNIISVASIDSDDNLSYFSNYGDSKVDIAAPGESILSTYPGNQYSYMSGTSMATPHVSGVLALLKAAYPNETYLELKNRLFNGADTLSTLNGLVRSARRLNVLQALDADNDSGSGSSKITISEFYGHKKNDKLFINKPFNLSFEGSPYENFELVMNVRGNKNLSDGKSCSLGSFNTDEDGWLSLVGRLKLAKSIRKLGKYISFTVVDTSAEARIRQTSRARFRTKGIKSKWSDAKLEAHFIKTCSKIASTLSQQ